ncbi:MAG: hypothetical protein KME21_28360 [Desmonostoc vinosum HA7617-LM4]|nr:hypothetical protein [Desmonostoc vinosum HA7617-LM4]
MNCTEIIVNAMREQGAGGRGDAGTWGRGDVGTRGRGDAGTQRSKQRYAPFPIPNSPFPG